MKKHIDFIPISFITTPDEATYYIPGIRDIKNDGIYLEFAKEKSSITFPLVCQDDLSTEVKTNRGVPNFYSLMRTDGGSEISLYPIPNGEFVVKMDAMLKIKES